MRLPNENKGTANYTYSSKPKKAKLSEQKEKGDTKKRSDNKVDKERQEVKRYKTCKRKYYRDYLYLKIKYFICHNVGYILAKYLKKSSDSTTSSSDKKKLCYIQKVTDHLFSKTKISHVLVIYLIGSCPQNPVIFIIIGSSTKYHFFSNRDLFTIYTEYDYQFEIRIGEKISAQSYGNIDLKITDHQSNTNILTVTNIS